MYTKQPPERLCSEPVAPGPLSGDAPTPSLTGPSLVPSSPSWQTPQSSETPLAPPGAWERGWPG